MTFYGIVSFKDKSLMKGEDNLGVWRDEIGWMCGTLDKVEFYRNKEAQQMHEFLNDIGEHYMLFMTINQAKNFQ